MKDNYSAIKSAHPNTPHREVMKILAAAYKKDGGGGDRAGPNAQLRDTIESQSQNEHKKDSYSREDDKVAVEEGDKNEKDAVVNLVGEFDVAEEQEESVTSSTSTSSSSSSLPSSASSQRQETSLDYLLRLLNLG